MNDDFETTVDDFLGVIKAFGEANRAIKKVAERRTQEIKTMEKFEQQVHKVTERFNQPASEQDKEFESKEVTEHLRMKTVSREI